MGLEGWSGSGVGLLQWATVQATDITAPPVIPVH